MKAHRNLTFAHLIGQAPDRLCLMIASEFWRARSRRENLENVRACYDRARELMGVLETRRLPASVALRLKPLYGRARLEVLLKPERLTPAFLDHACAEMAAEFEASAARLLADAPPAP